MSVKYTSGNRQLPSTRLDTHIRSSSSRGLKRGVRDRRGPGGGQPLEAEEPGKKHA